MKKLFENNSQSIGLNLEFITENKDRYVRIKKAVDSSPKNWKNDKKRLTAFIKANTEELLYGKELGLIVRASQGESDHNVNVDIGDVRDISIEQLNKDEKILTDIIDDSIKDLMNTVIHLNTYKDGAPASRYKKANYNIGRLEQDLQDNIAILDNNVVLKTVVQQLGEGGSTLDR